MVLGKLAYRNHMREEKNYWRKTNKLSKNLIGYESEAASESSEAAFFALTVAAAATPPPPA